ncbi:LLM class flavin-dependent oxidoreductase, partial [bacterium M00.F.Ca.ET.180.01.1.1]
IGRERGWGPTSRAHFDHARGPSGALFVGNPEQVAEKIVAQHKIFNNDRFRLQMAIGTMPHAKIMKAIELYGTKVAPLVRKETAKTAPAPAA